MSAFCTQCGSALKPGSTFCTACGAAVEPPIQAPRKPRRWPWVVALILLFALGFWLGRLLAPKCPLCPAPVAGAGGGGGGGGGGGSGGSGGGKGGMEGSGMGGGNGTTVGHGYDGSAVGAKGSDDAGGGQGSDPELEMKQSTKTGVWRLAAGAALSASSGDAPQANSRDATVRVLSARDFSYDRTALPRYADASQAILSALSYDTPGKTDTYGSASGIVTGSSFDDVVTWYRKSLPAGWSNTTLSDLNRLGAVAQQLTPDKILQMLNPQSSSAPGQSVGDTPATAAADRVRLSQMVVQHGDKPVQILMKTHVVP
jgi:hypothetical protein